MSLFSDVHVHVHVLVHVHEVLHQLIS